jgi:hypothetical protein
MNITTSPSSLRVKTRRVEPFLLGLHFGSFAFRDLLSYKIRSGTWHVSAIVSGVSVLSEWVNFTNISSIISGWERYRHCVSLEERIKKKVKGCRLLKKEGEDSNSIYMTESGTRQHQAGTTAPAVRFRSIFGGVLPCALTLTAYIQFLLMFLFSLFCRPFGGQKPSSVVDHGIWFFIKPDPFSRNVIRNCMNVPNSRSWVTLKTVMFHQFPRGSPAGDTGLIWREQNDRTWNGGHCVLCIHMLNTVIQKKPRSLSRFISRGGIGRPTFNEGYRMSDKWFRFLRLILRPWTAPRRIKPMHISRSTAWTVG